MEKKEKLRKFLIEELDGYIIPKNDEFFGEYISKHDELIYSLA